MQRAAVSIELNLAEGSGRGSDADFARFVVMGVGSASEVECLLLIARDLKLIAPDAHDAAAGECRIIKRMMLALHKKLKA